MRKMESSNPIFRKVSNAESYSSANTASFAGVTLKTGILLLMAVVAAIFANSLIQSNQMDTLVTILSVSGIVVFVSVLIGTLIPRVVVPFALLYAAAEGFVLGTLTIFMEMMFPENQIALTAILATGTIFGVMLLLYSLKVVRATPMFTKIMFGAMMGILIFSILSFFIAPLRELYTQNILVAALFIAFGAFMLVLDFDRAQSIVESGADKKYEWTVSLGLMVTIVWIYVQILRFLLIILSNKD